MRVARAGPRKLIRENVVPTSTHGPKDPSSNPDQEPHTTLGMPTADHQAISTVSHTEITVNHRDQSPTDLQDRLQDLSPTAHLREDRIPKSAPTDLLSSPSVTLQDPPTLPETTDRRHLADSNQATDKDTNLAALTEEQQLVKFIS